MTDPGGVVTYLPAIHGHLAGGAVTVTYPPLNSGTVVVASVQPGGSSREIIDGIERFVTKYAIYLLADPSTLNNGNGVQQDDAFAWSLAGNKLMIAQSDPNQIGTTWRVDGWVAE